MQVRHSVESVDQLIDQVGEGLDQGDARIGHVVIGPLGIAQLHESLRLVDEILESAIIEIRCGKRHGCSSEGIR